MVLRIHIREDYLCTHKRGRGGKVGGRTTCVHTREGGLPVYTQGREDYLCTHKGGRTTCVHTKEGGLPVYTQGREDYLCTHKGGKTTCVHTRENYSVGLTTGL